MRILTLACSNYDSHDNWERLPNAISSGMAWHSLLTVGSGKLVPDGEHRFVPDPTHQEAERGIQWLIGTAAPGILFFSGHGDCSVERSALILRDAKPKDRSVGRLHLIDLVATFDNAHNSKLLLVLDTCYAGSFDKPPQSFEWAPNVWILGASSNEEVLSIRDGETHSPFMQVVLSELVDHSNVDGGVSTAEKIADVLMSRRQLLTSSPYFRKPNLDDLGHFELLSVVPGLLPERQSSGLLPIASKREIDATVAAYTDRSDLALTRLHLIREWLRRPPGLLLWDRAPVRITSVMPEQPIYRCWSEDWVVREEILIVGTRTLDEMKKYQNANDLLQRSVSEGWAAERCAIQQGWRTFPCHFCRGRGRSHRLVCSDCSGEGELPPTWVPCPACTRDSRIRNYPTYLGPGASTGSGAFIEPQSAFGSIVGHSDLASLASEQDCRQCGNLRKVRSVKREKCSICLGTGQAECETCRGSGALVQAAVGSVTKTLNPLERLNTTPIEFGGDKVEIDSQNQLRINGVVRFERLPSVELSPAVHVAYIPSRSLKYKTLMGRNGEVLTIFVEGKWRALTFNIMGGDPLLDWIAAYSIFLLGLLSILGTIILVS